MRLLSTIMLALFLVFSMSGAVLAQEAQTNTTDPIIVGNQDAESLQVVQSYFETMDSNLLAEDVSYFDEQSIQAIEGRDMLTQSPTFMYGDSFTEQQLTPLRYIVTEDVVVVEYTFVGRNTGSYATLPATNQLVSVPTVGIYHVEDGQITGIREYMDSDDLYTQLGYPAYTGVQPVAPFTLPEPNAVDDIVDNPPAFYGQEVTIEGGFGEMVGPNAFTLWDEDFIDIGQEGLLVLAASDGAFDFTPVEETMLRVTGTVYEYDRASLEGTVGYALDEGTFTDYQNFTVLVASEIANMDNVDTLANVDQQPESFYGQTVTLEGHIGDTVGDSAFVLFRDQLVGVGGRVLVIAPDFDPATVENNQVQATGVVQPVDAPTIVTETGLTLDENLLSDYQDWTALIANEVMSVE